MPETSKLATKADLQEMYQRILPYLNRQEALANANYLAKIGETEYGEATYNGHLLTIPNADIIDRSNVYSTTEKIVGCWTDGRPIYQKTLAQTQIGSTSTDWTRITIPHGISNLYMKSYFKVVSACVHMSQPGTATWITDAIGYIPANNFSENKEIGFWIDDTNVNFEGIRPASWVDDSRTTYLYVTIQYCKTSDAANSYNYAGENDYSTSEKIVGTWIDGSTLYQKTIVDTTGSTNNTEKNISTGISNGANARIIEGYVNTAAGYDCPCNFVSETNTVYCFTRPKADASIITVTVGGVVNRPLTVTLQYTKTI